jgi:uncharacterized membrane protein (UPF0127 family)
MNPMSPLRVDGREVAVCEVAETWRSRFRGLLGRRPLPEALLLRPESSVHGVGMREALDVAVLDRDGVALAVLVLRPWGVTSPRRGAAAVLEAPVGSFARWGLVEGSTVTLDGDHRAAPRP